VQRDNHCVVQRETCTLLPCAKVTPPIHRKHIGSRNPLKSNGCTALSMESAFL
jgi:hypothetical protein